MVSDQKPSQAMSNDDIDDILELVDVVEVGKGVSETPSGDAEADFAADLDSMLSDLETKESEDMPFPDPTPVDYEVDANESLDLPSMDDLDNLLAELGAEKPEAPVQASDADASGDSLDSEGAGMGDENKASITAALDQALSNLDELDALDESLSTTLAPDEETLDSDELDDIFAKAAEAERGMESVNGTSPAPKPLTQADFETAEMVHPNDIFLDVVKQPEAEQATLPAKPEEPGHPEESSLSEEFSQPKESSQSELVNQNNFFDMADMQAQPEMATPAAPHTDSVASPLAPPERESLPIDIEGLEEASFAPAQEAVPPVTDMPQTPEKPSLEELSEEPTVDATASPSLTDPSDLLAELLPEASAHSPHGEGASQGANALSPETPEGESTTGMEPPAEPAAPAESFTGKEPETETAIAADIPPAETGDTPAEKEPLATAAVSGTRIDADLNELDALLDDMLSSAPPAVARTAEIASAESAPTADELHDILERLDNLESATSTEQLFERCNALEEQLAQKDATIGALEETLALKENRLASLEEALTGQQEQVATLESLLAEQKEHMASLDANMEKMVAAAAAKVIREEIAALIHSMQNDG